MTNFNYRRLGTSCIGSLTAAAIFMLSHAATAAASPASLVIGGKPVTFVVAPFVGNDGQLYAPVDFVRLMGASYVPSSDGASVEITTAAGTKITVPDQIQQGRYCVCVPKVASQMGASVDWQPGTGVLTLRAKLEMVRQESQALTIYTSYPVYYAVGHLQTPHRLYVDLNGVDLAASPATIPATNALVGQIRSGQMTFNTTRIVIDLKKKVAYKIASSVQTNRVEVALSGGENNLPVKPTVLTEAPVHTAIAPPAPAVTTPPAKGVEPPPLVIPPPVQTASNPANGAALRITGVSYKANDDGQLEVHITTNGAAKYRTETLSNPSRLAFDLADASIDDSVQRMLTVDDPTIKAIRAGILTAGQNKFGRIVVDMAHMVGYSIVPRLDYEGTTYILTLNRPTALPTPTPAPSTSMEVGPNDLHGKIIVVDPGHGADDSGAVGIGGLREKDLNLSIGQKLAASLIAAGATVHMTRDQDIKPSVGARPQMAIAWNADYFISIHCDESGSPNSHSGSTVYYHAQNQTCRHLASNIINRIAAVSGIPGLGVKSDTIRFQTGFGVLRGSPMPAVLVECGYMNSIKDLTKLCDLQNQQRIADAIVAGLRDFVSDQTAHR